MADFYTSQSDNHFNSFINEYILIKDLNDSYECANMLADLLHGLNIYVNLIPYNEVIEKPFKRYNLLSR
mgnify:CR=1 FL=1